MPKSCCQLCIVLRMAFSYSAVQRMLKEYSAPCVHSSKYFFAVVISFAGAVTAGMILCAEDKDGKFLGIVITILHKDIVLLDYLAVSPACRGQGIGSEILRLLDERYGGKRILLEIEDPEEPCDNPKERRSRKAFYLRNGMTVQDYKVWLFGIKMLILTNQRTVTFDEYHEIFDTVFSPKIGKNVSLAEE